MHVCYIRVWWLLLKLKWLKVGERGSKLIMHTFFGHLGHGWGRRWCQEREGQRCNLSLLSCI